MSAGKSARSYYESLCECKKLHLPVKFDYYLQNTSSILESRLEIQKAEKLYKKLNINMSNFPPVLHGFMLNYSEYIIKDLYLEIKKLGENSKVVTVESFYEIVVKYLPFIF